MYSFLLEGSSLVNIWYIKSCLSSTPTTTTLCSIPEAISSHDIPSPSRFILVSPNPITLIPFHGMTSIFKPNLFFNPPWTLTYHNLTSPPLPSPSLYPPTSPHPLPTPPLHSFSHSPPTRGMRLLATDIWAGVRGGLCVCSWCKRRPAIRSTAHKLSHVPTVNIGGWYSGQPKVTKSKYLVWLKLRILTSKVNAIIWDSV